MVGSMIVLSDGSTPRLQYTTLATLSGVSRALEEQVGGGQRGQFQIGINQLTGHISYYS
jgi:hypothetical protein